MCQKVVGEEGSLRRSKIGVEREGCKGGKQGKSRVECVSAVVCISATESREEEVMEGVERRKGS